MANQSITFSCPACGIKLTVPANLAGVVGPCPSCKAQIQAPSPNVEPPSQPIPVPVIAAPAQPPAGTPALVPPTLKPEPRQLPNRPHPAEVLAKQMPEPKPSGDNRSQRAAPLPSHPHTSSPIARFLMLILFLIASGALMFGVLTVVRMPKEGEAPSLPPATAPKEVDDVPEPAPVELGEPQPGVVPSLPTPSPPQATLIEPAPDLPVGMEPKTRGMEALGVLEQFLAAKSLTERLPMIESTTPEPELAASCLAGPLPATSKMLLEFQETTPLEEVVDLYYSVDFVDSGNRANPQTILVRTRGRETPKVVVDPFLDLFGGRLAAYVAQPSDKGGVFQVIASALASCTNPMIPNREKKLTLKLLARDNTKPVAEAYFGKLSKISEMLEDGTYSLSYGKAKACTVMLRWNTEEDEKNPYLEAIAIKALDWNP